MVLEMWNLSYLMADGMVNSVMLVLWGYLTFPVQGTELFEMAALNISVWNLADLAESWVVNTYFGMSLSRYRTYLRFRATFFIVIDNI